MNMRIAFNRAGLKLRKYSPQILTGLGVIGLVTGGVMACKATMKVNDILDETKKNVDKVHRVLEDPTITEETYSAEDGKKDLAIIYTKAGLKFIKLYAPSVIVGGVSIACILTSDRIMHKRNAAIAATCAAVTSDFRGYRSRVLDRFGEAIDHELQYDIKAQEVEEVVVNEKGEEETVTKVVEVANATPRSDFSKFFDCGNKGWEPDPEFNYMYLTNLQNYLTDKLRANGYLFLNDVYDELGIPRTRAGQLYGWLYDEKNPHGANHVDFGLRNADDERRRAFVNGYEATVILDFNCDAEPIYNLI
jgi:hypothetical protein